MDSRGDNPGDGIGFSHRKIYFVFGVIASRVHIRRLEPVQSCIVIHDMDFPGPQSPSNSNVFRFFKLVHVGYDFFRMVIVDPEKKTKINDT